MTFRLYHLIIIGGLMFYLGFAIGILFTKWSKEDDELE